MEIDLHRLPRLIGLHKTCSEQPDGRNVGLYYVHDTWVCGGCGGRVDLLGDGRSESAARLCRWLGAIA